MAVLNQPRYPKVGSLYDVDVSAGGARILSYKALDTAKHRLCASEHFLFGKCRNVPLERYWQGDRVDFVSPRRPKHIAQPLKDLST